MCNKAKCLLIKLYAIVFTETQGIDKADPPSHLSEVYSISDSL